MLSLSGMDPGGIIYYQFCPDGAGRGYCPGTRPRWGGDLRWEPEVGCRRPGRKQISF